MKKKEKNQTNSLIKLKRLKFIFEMNCVEFKWCKKIRESKQIFCFKIKINDIIIECWTHAFKKSRDSIKILITKF